MLSASLNKTFLSRERAIKKKILDLGAMYNDFDVNIIKIYEYVK